MESDDMNKAPIDIELDEGQKKVLEEFHLRFERSRTQFERRRSAGRLGEQGGRHLFTFEPYENVFGILGPRGAGKSTVLFELHRRLRSRFDGAGREVAAPLVLRPLDCTALPPEVVPGAAVLLHLLQYLETLALGHDSKNRSLDLTSQKREMKSIVGTYSRTTKAFLDLCLDLSTSTSEYGEYFAGGIKERMELSLVLGRILNSLGDSLGFDYIVIFLDDFDLVPADSVRSWLSAFLDDLHQERLVFVVTADFHRLEYLSWKAEDQIDDKTGRALLGKIIPVGNRFEIKPWGRKAQLRFRPAGSAEKDLDSILKSSEMQKSTAELGFGSCFWKLCKQLLPEFPRGLRSLHSGLERQLAIAAMAAASAEDSPDEAKEVVSLREFLQLLAVSRQEPLFARRVGSVAVSGWPAILRVGVGTVDEIEWRQLVRGALQRFERAAAAVIDGLEVLVPFPAPADFRRAALREDRPRSVGESRAFVGAQLQHDPQWTDPLRHDHLRLLPLRDVADKDLALWTEMLLDLGFAQDVTQRVAFIFSWAALSERLKKCVIRLEVSRIGLNEFFSDNHGKIQREVFAWIEIRNVRKVRRLGGGPSSYSMSVGLEPLLNVFKSGREIVPWLLLEHLRIGRGWQSSAPGAPPIDPAEQGRMIPGTVSAMILFMEGLERCPWEAFSGKISHPVILYLAVACSFVSAAFLWALCETGLVDIGPSDTVQGSLLGLISRSRQDFIDLPADEILVECWRFLSSDLNVPPDNPLADALGYFCQSPFYTSVLGLLRVQPEILEISVAGVGRAADQPDSTSETVS